MGLESKGEDRHGLDGIGDYWLPLMRRLADWIVKERSGKESIGCSLRWAFIGIDG